MTCHVTIKSFVLFLFVGLGGFIHCSQARGQGAASYAVVDIGDVGGRGTFAWGINDAGEVIASTIDAQNNALWTLIWNAGEVRFLDPLVPSMDAKPYDINDAGEVVGKAYVGIGVQHAVLWLADGTPVDLGTLGGKDSVAAGINEAGQIVGGADLLVEGSHPFLWQDGQMIDLGDLGRPSGGANAINEVGQVAGVSGILPFSSRAFLWENGEMFDLGTLPDGGQTIANDINDAGVIVGEGRDRSSLQNAVIWEDRVIRSIHNPSIAFQSVAHAVNELGQVVGFLEVDAFPEHFSGFLYEGSGPMVDIMTLLPPRHRWRQIMGAWDLNNAGEIVSYGDRIGGSNGDYRGVLLTPVHPTLTLQGPQPGTAGTLNGIRASGCTPGARVHFFYSTTGGGTLVPGCNHTDGVTLQLENPIRAGTATANANGIATLTRFIPRNAANLGEVLIQAVDADNCQISQLVVHQFE